MPGPDLAVVFPAAGAGGGVERVAFELTRYEAMRRAVTFVGERAAPGIPHTLVRATAPIKSLRPLAFRRAASRALERLGAKTVVSFGANCPPGDVLWVQSVHRAWLDEGGEVRFRGVVVPPAARKALLRHQVLLAMERAYFTSDRPRTIICTSNRERDDIVRLYGVDSSRIYVIPNGVDPIVFNPLVRDEMRASMRRSIGATEGQLVLLLVANEWNRKGLGTLLSAVAEIDDDRLRVDLVGSRSPDDYWPVAARLGIADRVHWHGHSADVMSYLAAADVFVLPTTYEPFGIVIAEAMAAGLPVVVSALAGASEAIDPGVSGFTLRDPRDVHELARAVAAAAACDRTAVGAAASVAAERFHWERVLERADRAIFPA